MAFKLICAIIGEESLFSVIIDQAQTVHELKNCIKKEKQHGLASYAATSLTLFKLNTTIPDDEAAERVTQDIRQGSIKDTEKMVPVFRLSRYFNEEDFCETKVHIVIQLPQGESIDPRLCGAVA